MTEGKDHHILDKRHIFTTTAIDNYLKSDRVQFLISSKGMGKTLLLRYKRHELNRRDAQYGSIVFLPEKKEYDIPKLSGSFSQTDPDFESISFWTDLWLFSIIMSTVTHIFANHINSKSDEPIWDLIDSMGIGNNFKYFYSGRLEDKLFTEASIIMSEVVSNSKGSFVRDRANIMNRVKEIGNKYITSGIYYFIDAFDSTLTSRFLDNIQVWSAGQQGLILASFRISLIIEHLKVFATIRQEAWNVFRHDDRQAISGKALNLKYTFRQLEALLNKLVQIYEHRNSLRHLTSLSEIPNYTCQGEPEEIFRYIYRHIIPTPRALSIIGRAIAESDLLDIEEEQEKIVELRNIVDKESIRIVIEDFLFSQQKYFMSFIQSKDDLNSLCKYIPSNILPGWSLESINYWFSKSKFIKKENSHPFCELLNIGLIGITTIDSTNQKHIQYFRDPNTFEQNTNGEIHQHNLYFLHPALSAYTSQINTHCKIQPVIVGQQRIIPDHIYDFIPSIFVSHSSKDKTDVKQWLNIFKRHLDIVISNKFWIDDAEIPYGGNIVKYIEKGIMHSALLFLFLTEESIKSGWVQEEWESKKLGEISNNKISIVVILKDGLKQSSIPRFLSTKKYFKFEDYENEHELKQLSLNCRQFII